MKSTVVELKMNIPLEETISNYFVGSCDRCERLISALQYCLDMKPGYQLLYFEIKHCY